jgi:hypothetical protein
MKHLFKISLQILTEYKVLMGKCSKSVSLPLLFLHLFQVQTLLNIYIPFLHCTSFIQKIFHTKFSCLKFSQFYFKVSEVNPLNFSSSTMSGYLNTSVSSRCLNSKHLEGNLHFFAVISEKASKCCISVAAIILRSLICLFSQGKYCNV